MNTCLLVSMTQLLVALKNHGVSMNMRYQLTSPVNEFTIGTDQITMWCPPTQGYSCRPSGVCFFFNYIFSFLELMKKYIYVISEEKLCLIYYKK